MQGELKSARKVLRKPALQFTKVAQEEFLCVGSVSAHPARADTGLSPASRSRLPKQRRLCRPTGSASIARSRSTATAARSCTRWLPTRSSSGRRRLPQVRADRMSWREPSLTSLTRSRKSSFPRLLAVRTLPSSCERGTLTWERLIREVSSHYEFFRSVIASVATADCLFGLALVALSNNWVRPTITDNPGYINFVDGRHPIIEDVSSEPFVPNSVKFGGGERRQMILTGLNMGGELLAVAIDGARH